MLCYTRHVMVSQSPEFRGKGGEAKKTYVSCHLPEIRGMKLLECHAPILLQVGQLGVYYRLGGARIGD